MTVSEHYGAEGLLKMLEDFAKAGASEDVLTTLESALMVSWKDKGMSLDDVSKLLKEQQTDDLLRDKLLKTFRGKLAEKNSTLPDVAAVTTDDVKNIRKIEDTEDVVSPQKDPVVNSEILDGKSADDAFTALKLDKAGDKLFSNPNFGIWFQFVVKETGTLPESAIKTVSRHYNAEDLLKMFEAVDSKAEASKAVLTTLESTLMVAWKRQNISVDDVFKLLKLDQRTDDPLYDKLLKMWVKYVNENASVPDVALRVIIGGYDVKTRVTILDRLKEIEGTEGAVKRLQKSVVESLLQDGKSADDAFTALKLDKAGDKLFSNPNFGIWFQFVVKETGTLPVLAIKTVSEHYGAEGLLKMLEDFAKAGASENVLTTLESALMVSWKDKGMSANDVFKLLKLDQQADDTLYDRLLKMWVDYVEKSFDSSVLMMRFVIASYTDAKTCAMILGGLRKIKGTDEVVQPLQNSLVKRFQGREGSFKDQVVQVFRDLNLQDGLKTLLHNPNLDLFNRFAAKFEPETSKEASLITASRDVYGDIPLGKMLEAAWQKKDATATPLRAELFRQWLLEVRKKQAAECCRQLGRATFVELQRVCRPPSQKNCFLNKCNGR